MEREKSSGRVRARFDLRFSLVGGAVAGARSALPHCANLAMPRNGDVTSFWVACRKRPPVLLHAPRAILEDLSHDSRANESPHAALTATFAPTPTGALLSRQQRDRESPLFAFLKHVGRFSSPGPALRRRHGHFHGP